MAKKHSPIGTIDELVWPNKNNKKRKEEGTSDIDGGEGGEGPTWVLIGYF